MNSIRLFLTISIVSTIILVNFLAALHGYQESMQESEILFDHKLEDFSNFLAYNTSKNSQTKASLDYPEKLEHSDDLADSVIYQIRDINYQLIAQSNFIESNSEKTELKTNQKLENTHINFANFRWRLITRYYQDKQIWISVMEKQDVRYQLAESVILKSVYPIIIAVPSIALIIFFIVRRGLKPIEQLARNVDKKQASNLSAIKLDAVPVELSQLTQRINELLSRLENTLSREKRFASDAAHELRTPIAALNIQMKNLIDETEGEISNVGDLNLGVKRMSHLVEQILTLNRSSPELYMDQFKKVDLTKLLKELVAELYSLIDEKGHEIELKYLNTKEENAVGEKVESCYVMGEEFALHTLFKNLVVNAIKYTPSHGKILINLEQNENTIKVTVMDSGPGIKQAERERIFERFYRLDGDRNSSKVIGCGLGLAIVKQVADLHHAKIVVGQSDFLFDSKKITKGLSMEVIFRLDKAG